MFRASKATLLRMLILTVLVLGQGFTYVHASNQTVKQNAPTYLPLITKAPPPFTGTVTFQGGPAAGVDLRMFLHTNGGTQQVVYATVTTGLDGKYTFPYTPFLEEGDYFNVDYSLDREGALAYFRCSSVTNQTTKYGCNFDITDIALQNPADGASAALPSTFSWVKRPYATESYYFNILKFVGSKGSEVYKSEALGYADSFTLLSFPGGLTGTEYQWSVGFTTPEGEGHSEQFNRVTFTSLGQ